MPPGGKKGKLFLAHVLIGYLFKNVQSFSVTTANKGARATVADSGRENAILRST